MEAAPILLSKTSSPYPAPEAGGYGTGVKDAAGMYEGPGSFTALLSDAAAREAGGSGAGERGSANRDSSAAERGKKGKDAKAAAADTAEKSDGAADGEKAASREAENLGEKSSGENQPEGKNGKSGTAGKGERKAAPEVKRDPKIINMKTGKHGAAEKAEKAEKKVPDDPTAVVREAALAGEKELKPNSHDNDAVKALEKETSGGSGKPAAVTLEMNTEKTEKQFFFIDKRSAGSGKTERQPKKSAGKEGTGTLLKTAAEKSEKSGKSGENPRFQKDAGVEKGGEPKTVKEELLDSSEKFVKVTAELQGRQTVREQTDSFGQKHTQSAVLQRHLAEQGNRQIVRQSGILLKDNNSGEIRLVLKPESLGNVRVQLQMQDNTITGKIIVDNSAVKTAFEQNMEDLYKAFKESGFDNARLDVEVGGGKSGHKQERDREYTGPALHHVRVLEEQIPLSGGGKSADTLIDLVI